MESLLANYASEEEEEEDTEKEEKKDSFPSSKPTPKPLSLSPPKQHNPSSGSSSIFSSLPRPKSSPSSIFSSIPPPKSHPSKTPIPSSSDPTPKRVVQFRPPLNPFHLKSQHPDIDDDDDDDDKDQAKPTKKIPFSIQNAPSKSFSSALPAPKNSLCLAPSRKSTVEATTAHKAAGDVSRAGLNTGAYENLGNYESSSASVAQGMGNAGGGNYVNYGSYQGNSGDWPLVEGSGNDENYQNLEAGSIDGLSGMGSENYGNYANHMSHEGNAIDGSLLASGENYVNYGSYEGNWVDGSTAVMSSGPSATSEGIGRIMGKRGRNEIPADIVEVKQDELISNRPREDQVKLTGIAFGPAYQPVSSSKGKPTKLHKRKHQIGSLYFDMKQKEMELAERRSKGFLTKAETQAKYGW